MKTFWHLGNGTPDYRSIMREHKDFAVDSKTIAASKVVIAEQTHSDNVHICTDNDSGAGFGEHPQIADTDALITIIPYQYILIRTADCTPVLLLDNKGRAAGAIHSGREGTRKNISGKTVAVFDRVLGIKPNELTAYIGAGICHRHYPVDERTWLHYNESLREQGFVPDTTLNLHINIRRDIFQQLIAAGIPFRNIEQICDCTFEAQGYHSFRRSGTNNRQISLVGLEI